MFLQELIARKPRSQLMNFQVNKEVCEKKLEIETKLTNCSGAILKLTF